MSKTKERIRDSQLRYKQGLGQNFIYDETLLEELVRLSGVGPEDDVLEIGPGQRLHDQIPVSGGASRAFPGAGRAVAAHDPRVSRSLSQL